MKNRKHSVDLYSPLMVQNVAKVVRRGRLRWFGHVERKSGDNWVPASINVVVAGVRYVGRCKKYLERMCEGFSFHFITNISPRKLI